MAAKKRMANFNFLGKNGIITVAAGCFIAVGIIWANVEKGVICFQNAVVVPIVKKQFDVLIKPFKKDQDTLIKNSKITIEMLQIGFGDSTSKILNKAINNVERPAGTFRRSVQ